MMNLIAIGLIITSLAVAGVFSPNPQKNYNGGEQLIVKNGHRAVIVEYADAAGDGNTKVSISPQPTKPDPIEEQISLAAASVAGVAQDAKGKAKEAILGPRELICDAYGKCKHVIGGALNRAKEKVVDAEEEVKEVVGGAVDKAKDLATRASHKAEECTEVVRENAKEKMRETGEKVRETEEKVENVKEKAGEVAEETEEKIKQKGKQGKKELSDITRRGEEVIFDAIRYVIWSESISSLMGVIHLLGFAMAYGISVWVTFIMSHVLAGLLPRQQFGLVQSKIYPVYFKAMASSIGLALIGQLMGQRTRNKANMLQACNLMGLILSVLANLLFLEPKATKVMFQRMKLEKEEGRGREQTSSPKRVIDTVVTDTANPITTTSTATSVAATPRLEQDVAKSEMVKLDERLKKLNSYSSLLNITTIIGLTWHLVYLSQSLQIDSS